MMVMMMAMTPSLKVSTLVVPIFIPFFHGPHIELR